MDRLLKAIDWFIPDAATLDRSELGLARNFVATHILGPLLSQSISVLLLMTDPEPGFAAWTMVTCVCLFWTLPFILVTCICPFPREAWERQWRNARLILGPSRPQLSVGVPPSVHQSRTVA